jgi:hypothetical protein
LTNDAIGLKTFNALKDVEDDLLALLETFVTIFLNRAEMDEYIIAAIVAKEAIALGTVKPFHYAFILAHRVHLSMGITGFQVAVRLILQTNEAFT